MKERPILFSGPMVRAILDGRKTQTRRVVKPQPNAGPNGEMVDLGGAWGLLDGILSGEWRCPYGGPGDRLYVKESWKYWDWTEDGEPFIQYAADDATDLKSVPEDWGERVLAVWAELSDPVNFQRHAAARDNRWRPSIFMPRWTSRILLEITEVRVQRVQEIGLEDISAEGLIITASTTVPGGFAASFEDAKLQYPWNLFSVRWDAINAKRGLGWDSNPWVWAITFRRVKP